MYMYIFYLKLLIFLVVKIYKIKRNLDIKFLVVCIILGGVYEEGDFKVIYRFYIVAFIVIEGSSYRLVIFFCYRLLEFRC